MNNFDKKLMTTDKGKQVMTALRDTMNDGGGLVVTHIRHDGWCAFLNGKGECDCDPDIEVERVQGTP